MTTHSKIGASSCERWWNCPGSVALIEKCPPQPESKYAAEGTAAHAMAEWCLKNNLTAWDAHKRCSVETGDKDHEWDLEMVDHVQMYLDTIDADLAKHGLTRKDLQIEQKFHLAHIHPDAFGTNDANLQVFLTKVIVYDFKYGSGVAVDAEENKQLLYYALGAAVEGDYTEVEMVIIQPRAIHRDGPVRRWTITKKELDDFAEMLKERIELVTSPGAELRCGEWCRKTFCPAMPICPAVRKKVEMAAMVAFSDTTKEITLKPPEELCELTMRRLLQSMPLIDAWLKSVWSYAENKANNGGYIHGFKLVRGREGNRKWKDEGYAEKALKSYGSIYEPLKLKSPAQMEKLFDKKSTGRVLVDQLTERTPGKPILVPDDDPREEVKPAIESVFNQEERDIFL